MAQLLVALDDSAAARPVVEVARYVADLVDLEVVALHVSENGTGATARDRRRERNQVRPLPG